MKKLSVEALVPEKKEGDKVITAAVGPYTITVDAPETAEEAIAMFGGEAVLTNAIANWVVTLQGNMRSGMRKGESATALQTRLSGAKMGVSQKGVKVDPIQAYLAQFEAATPEAQAKMLAELKDRAKKK